MLRRLSNLAGGGSGKSKKKSSTSTTSATTTSPSATAPTPSGSSGGDSPLEHGSRGVSPVPPAGAWAYARLLPKPTRFYHAYTRNFPMHPPPEREQKPFDSHTHKVRNSPVPSSDARAVVKVSLKTVGGCDGV
jgi:hypothetical protein